MSEFDPVEYAVHRVHSYAGGGSVASKLAELLGLVRGSAQEVAPLAHAEEAVAATGKAYTPTGRTIPRDDQMERLQSLVTNQPTTSGNYQWQVIKPSGEIHGAPFDFKGSALHVADALNQDTPGHTVQALSIDNPAISRYAMRTPDQNANPFKKATAEDIDRLLSNPPGMAEGGDVESSPEEQASFNAHSSLRRLADAARALDNPTGTDPNAENRARVTSNLAGLLYGLDAHGNPVLGGRAWTSTQGGTPMGLLDVATSVPHNVVGLAKLIDKYLPGKSNPQFWDSVDPQWSKDAATRLAQLRQKVQQTAGVGAADSLPATAIDMATDMAVPTGVSRLSAEGTALRRALPWVTSAAGEEGK